MESYRTEEEQIEAIRKWWQENGMSTVIGVLLAIAGVFGYRMWDQQQSENLAEAGQMYHLLLEADEQAANDPARRTTALHLAGRLQSEHGDKAYAAYAGLFLAKYAAADGKWELAESTLRDVLTKNPDETLALQVQIRLAQALFAQQKSEQALAILDAIPAGPVSALAGELRGDILMQQGNHAAALAAYREAQTASADVSRGAAGMLDMKITHLEQQLATEADPS